VLLVLLVGKNGCTWTVGSVSVNGVAIPHKKITWEDKARLSEGNSEIYYSAGNEALAAEALQILCAEEKIIQETLGLKPKKFGIVLHGPMVPHEYEPIVSCPPTYTIWAVAMLVRTNGQPALLDDPKMYGTMTHERTEETLTDAVGKNGLYVANPQTRWIGDGLAEYLAYKTCRTLSPATSLRQLKNRRSNLDDMTMQNFNLLIWRSPSRHLLPFTGHADESWAKKELKKLGDQAKFYAQISGYGYAMSLAFWKDFADRHGEDVLKKFVGQLTAQSDLSNKAICGLLETMTAENVYDHCQSINIQKAKDILDRAISEIEKPAQEKAIK